MQPQTGKEIVLKRDFDSSAGGDLLTFWDIIFSGRVGSEIGHCGVMEEYTLGYTIKLDTSRLCASCWARRKYQKHSCPTRLKATGLQYFLKGKKKLYHFLFLGVSKWDRELSLRWECTISFICQFSR